MNEISFDNLEYIDPVDHVEYVGMNEYGTNGEDDGQADELPYYAVELAKHEGSVMQDLYSALKCDDEMSLPQQLYRRLDENYVLQQMAHMEIRDNGKPRLSHEDGYKFTSYLVVDPNALFMSPQTRLLELNVQIPGAICTVSAATVPFNFDQCYDPSWEYKQMLDDMQNLAIAGVINEDKVDCNLEILEMLKKRRDEMEANGGQWPIIRDSDGQKRSKLNGNEYFVTPEGIRISNTVDEDQELSTAKHEMIYDGMEQD